MTYYILARQFDGELATVSTEPVEPSAGQIALCRDGRIPDLAKYEWHPGSLAFIEKNRSRWMSKIEFLERVTGPELVAIYTLAESDINVEVWLDKFKMADEICLDSRDLQAALPLFELAGILAPGRAAEILS